MRRGAAEAKTRAFPRDRLYARLDAALRAPIVLVVADEGLGKSTLIRDYLALRGIAHLRFAAEPEHAAPGELLRGLAAAFGPVSPAMARSVGPAAAKLEQTDGEAAALGWAREHLANVSATVVLDELHHLAGEPRCVSFLRALIEATVPRIRWIVALRDASALPVPVWMASGQCDLPIESDELRVQPDEIGAAFARAGIALREGEARSLFERTAGWPLGLAVALATGRVDAPLTRDDVYEGLVDAAFRRLAEDQRDRVFETAAIGRFDETILAALECDAELAAVLAESELVHAADDGGYAYYEPCRSRIALRLERLAERRRSAVLDRAAGALERTGRWREAIALRVRAGDEDRVAAALDRRGFTALDHGEVAAVGAALAALGDRALTAHPLALALKAALASLDESFDVSEAWFQMAVERAHDHERREIVIRYGMDLVRRGRHDAIELLEAEAAREETRGSADADAALWALLGTAYVEAHRPASAREAAHRAIVRLPGVGDDALRARVLHQASYVALNEGDYAMAKSLAERALARAEEQFLYDLAARALSVLFNVAMLHDDDVEAARGALLRLEEAGRKAGNAGLRLYAILNAYAIEVDAGDVVALERLNAQLGEMQVLLTPMVSEGLLPAQALRAAWDGRFEHAYDLLAPGAEKLFDDDRTAYRWAEVAVYGAAAGKDEAARAAIAHSRESLRKLADDQPLSVRTMAYLALAETLLADDEAAAASIAQAREAATHTHGRIRSLVETVAAFYFCRARGHDAVLWLGEMFDELEHCELGGVARFIGRLPLTALERRARRRTAVLHGGAR
ncbi:MAG TPA: AAA family ATPase [Candidatus Elarobacter sp.]|jgi:LuxR family maltose regulon positive regulatory protein|nr:AAA family ATPase [Candidatus Elarobacter sp.]